MSQEACVGSSDKAKKVLVVIVQSAGVHHDTEERVVAMDEATQEGFDRLVRAIPRLTTEHGYRFCNGTHGVLFQLYQLGRIYDRPVPTLLAGDPMAKQEQTIVFFRRRGEGLFVPEWYARAALEAEGIRHRPSERSGAAH